MSVTTPTQQRWGSGSTLGISPSGSASSTRVGAIVGSPISVAGAVAASAAAAAAAAASAASVTAGAVGLGDVGRGAGTGGGGVGTGGGGVGATGGGAGGASEKLVQLKKEKRMLHVMLKNFEKEFKEKNGREVRVGGKGGLGRVYGGRRRRVVFACSRVIEACVVTRDIW